MSKYFFTFARTRRFLAAAPVLSMLAPWIFLFGQPSLAAAQTFNPSRDPVRTIPQRPIKSDQLVSTTVVISQFQVAGGTAADEFVELHNISNSGVDLNGYNLVYRAAAATTDSTLLANWAASTVIPPGGYYLVTATPGYDGTVTGDKTFTDGGSGRLAGAGGGLALRNGPQNTGPIVDSVGFGTATNAFIEGTVTPAPAANASRARNSNGCADTDNNASDFSLVNPSTPRNSATAANVCGGGGGPTNPSGAGAANPNSVSAGSNTLLTVTVTPGTNPTSTGITVSGNLTAIGGSATQTFFDDGTNGDVTIGDNIFSFQATVPIATSTGSKNLPVQIADAQARTGSSAITLTVTPPPAVGQPLPFLQNWSNTNLITTTDDWSGVPGIVGYRGDDLTTAIGTDPQTILVDGSATPVNVSANQTNPNTFTSGGIAEFDTLPNPVVAFQGSGTADAPNLVISLNTTGKHNITVAYNLRDVDGSDDDAIQPVALQYRIGSSGNYTNIPAAFVADASSGPAESSLVTPVNVALPVAVEDQSLVQLRIMTTNANGSDELIGIDDIAVVADGVIPLSASGGANPGTVVQGNTTLLTTTVNPAVNPNSTGITVTGDLTAIGGSATQTFFDDGSNGDATPGDNIFSYLATVPVATTTGAKSLPVSVADAQARTFNFGIELTVIAPGGGSPHTPDEHLVMGNPTSATTDVNFPNNYLLPKNQYVMSYDRDRAIPNWVSWHLDSSWIGGAARQNDFRNDPSLPAGWYQVQGTSYSGSGFDRGHHTPSADRTDTVPDNSATFFMTNMMPQAPGNNQGPWEKLESYGRTLVGQGNELYIVAGGYGSGGIGDNGPTPVTTIDAGRIAVPSYTWKVILVQPVGENDLSRVTASTRAFAVIMPNNTAIRPDEWQKYLATVDQVEALTGYDFFSNVDPSIQNQIESRLDTISNTSPQTVAGGVYTNLDVSDRPQINLTGNVTVTGNLNLGPSIINTGNFTLTLAPGATITRISGYVTGQLGKQFDVPVNGFVYPVGTANGYSPVTVDVTAVGPPALGVVASTLTVKAVQGPQPNVPNANLALQRYWTLTNSGPLTANLTFQYQQLDVPAGVTESSFKLNRFEGTFTEVPSTLNTAANTVTATGISQFSDWTLIGLAPTAAHVRVSGRAVTANGGGIFNAIVTLTDAQGQIKTSRTNQFGYYNFDDVPAGGVYVLGAIHKRYTFAPAVVSVSDEITDINLIAIEP